ALERRFGAAGNRLDPAHLAHVLACGCLNFLAGGRRFQAPQRRDVAAHAPDATRRRDTPASRPSRAAGGTGRAMRVPGGLPPALTQAMFGISPVSDQVQRRLLTWFSPATDPMPGRPDCAPSATPPMPAGRTGIEASVIKQPHWGGWIGGKPRVWTRSSPIGGNGTRGGTPSPLPPPPARP